MCVCFPVIRSVVHMNSPAHSLCVLDWNVAYFPCHVLNTKFCFPSKCCEWFGNIAGPDEFLFYSTCKVLFIYINKKTMQTACMWNFLLRTQRLMVKANSWMRRNWILALSALFWAYCCNKSPVYYDGCFITGRPNLAAYLTACPFWGESGRDEKQREHKGGKANCLKIELFGTCRHWLTLNRKCFHEYFVALLPNMESSHSCSKSPHIY